MKKHQISLILVLTILFTSFASFGEIVYDYNLNEIINNAKLVEEDVLSKGINIQYELEQQVNLYKGLLNKNNNIKDSEKLQQLLNTSTELLDFYNNYNLEKVEKDNIEILAIDPGRSAVKLAVASISSLFNANGYFLAGELLLHAQDNKVKDSEYSPYFDSHLQSSPEIKKIRISSRKSGKAEFNKDGTKVGADLYYAIHGFSWDKNGSMGRINVKDRYDYAVSDYSGLQNYAVNAMYWAQQFGYIVPFQVRIYNI